MTIQFKLVDLAEIRSAITAHLTGLPSPIDSFLESHIISSSHHRILIAGEEAGFTSIHDSSLITQFVLSDGFKHQGQQVFARVKQLESVSGAFVSTGDEFFLAHALDQYNQLAPQAYFFVSRLVMPALSPRYQLQPAQMGDGDFIRHETKDFFGDVEDHIEHRRLFLTTLDGTCVGFGLQEHSHFSDSMASIGMFTIEKFRQQGVGTATLALLQVECQRQDLRPIAGCWYYNHISKRTLERSGMYTQTRLLKFGF